MIVIFDRYLRTPNKFKHKDWKELENYGSFIRGSFVLTSPNIDGFKLFCDQNGYKLDITDDLIEWIEKNRNTFAYYKENRFHIKFNNRFNAPIVKKKEWMQIANKDFNSNDFIFHYYTFLIAINLLDKEGYHVIYDDEISFLEYDRTDFNEIKKPQIIENWTPMLHQIESANIIYQWNGKGIIGDEAGLGKTTTAILSLQKIFNNLKYKRGIWVVPTIPLIFQVVEELRDRFGIQAFPITQGLKKRFEKEGKSVYDLHPFCVLTWSTFRNDWNKNLKYVWKIPFGFGIFDEVHICSKYKNKSYDAVLNFQANVRIGLTGTPSTNGKWNELYNIIYLMNPKVVNPIYYYIDREKTLLSKFEKNPKDHELPEKTAIRVMNKITNSELTRKIVRHERKELSNELPEINEIDPIHVTLNGSEDLILEKMFAILESIIEEWIMDRKNFIINFAKSMIWQDLRRFCSYGGKNFDRRIQLLLSEKKPVYNFIQNRYKTQLIEIYRELRNHPILDYPKFPILFEYLNKIPNHHVLIFCDSIITSIDMVEYLSNKGIDCKVVTGKLNYSNFFENISQSRKHEEEERIKNIFIKIGQRGKMTDAEVKEAIDWFWSPYIYISELAEKMNIEYSIDDDEWINYCYYVHLKKAKTIAFKIFNYSSLSKSNKKFLKSVINEIKKIDQNIEIIEKEGTKIYRFKNKELNYSKVLITTNKLSEGANLQIAQSVVFFDQPLSIKEREQRLARIHRMGSPYSQIYFMSLICGIEYAVKRTVDEKYRSTGKMKFSESKNVSIRQIVKNMKKINKLKKRKNNTKNQLIDYFFK